MIRRATETDIPALCRLMQSVQALHAEAHPEIYKATLEPEATAAFFIEVLANDHNLVFVAEEGDEIVGYLWCQDRPPADSFYAHRVHTGYIHHISVDSRYRRRGIGRALIERAFADLKQRGAIRVGVDFWSFNEAARAFFARHGFAVQREVCSRKLP